VDWKAPFPTLYSYVLEAEPPDTMNSVAFPSFPPLQVTLVVWAATVRLQLQPGSLAGLTVMATLLLLTEPGFTQLLEPLTSGLITTLPPLVAVAVKVTVPPAQMLVELADTLTLAVKLLLTVTLRLLEVTGAGLIQVLPPLWSGVMTTVTMSLLVKVLLVKVT
jgi:hypothetical protein